MAEDQPPQEPIISQITTVELKRILTDRFAANVVKESWNRIWRPLTFLGVTGIVAASTLIFSLIDSRISTKSDLMRDGILASANTRLNEQLTARMEGVSQAAQARINEAFLTQYGQRVNDTLRQAMQTDDFKRQLDSIVTDGLRKAWEANSQDLRTSFMAQLSNREDFRTLFASDVVRELTRTRAVTGIITDSLLSSVETRSADDAGVLIALALLAAMDQTRANAGVGGLVERARTSSDRAVALQALAAVGFANAGGPEDGPVALLQNVLRTWHRYCGETVCASNASARTALAGFLGRGRELPEPQRRAWVTTLSQWHGEFIEQPDAPGREISLDMVPRALARIGSPEAIEALAGWAQSDSLDLALSAAAGVGDLPADDFPDIRRVALFRRIWDKIVDPTNAAAAVEEAAWMAVGMISRGAASATRGPYLAEAALSRSYLSTTSGNNSNSGLAAWANGRTFDFEELSEIARPPRDPCGVGNEQRNQSVSRMRPGLCALIALMRPAGGSPEWFRLRPYLTHRDRLALLGLLWAMASDRTSARSTIAPTSQLAPLPDLLTLAQPTPPLLQLTAILIARTMSDREAWMAFEDFRNVLADTTPFVAANRWLHRSSEDDRTWFLERIRALQAPDQHAVLVTMFSSLDPTNTVGRGRAQAAFSRSLRENSTAILNILSLALAANPDTAAELLERNDGFRELFRVAASARQPVGFDATSARQIAADIMRSAGWMPFQGSAPTPIAMSEGRAALAPQDNGRFGMVGLPTAPGTFLRLSSTTGPVVFFNPESREAVHLRPNQIWVLPRAQAAQAPTRSWAFRLASTEAAELRLEMPQPLDLSPDGPGTIEPGQLSRVRLDQRGDSSLRVEGISRGDVLEVATYGLDSGVDTVVEFVRDDIILASDDDGGEGFASRLAWESDRDGPLRLRLRNIGRSGGFSVLLTVQKP